MNTTMAEHHSMPALLLELNVKGCVSVCSTIYWAIIIPVVAYRSSLLALRGDEIEKLMSFQRLIGRRCQRFPSHSLNFSAFCPSGWITLDWNIEIRKHLFLHAIMAMKDNAIFQENFSQQNRGVQ